MRVKSESEVTQLCPTVSDPMDCILPGSSVPWDFTGKSTGVSCHFLLHCMTVKSESEVAQSRPTPSDPMDCSLPGSSIHGIFQAPVLEWGAIAFSIVDPKEYQRLFQGVCEVKNIFTILLQHHLLFTLC